MIPPEHLVIILEPDVHCYFGRRIPAAGQGEYGIVSLIHNLRVGGYVDNGDAVWRVVDLHHQGIRVPDLISRADIMESRFQGVVVIFLRLTVHICQYAQGGCALPRFEGYVVVESFLDLVGGITVALPCFDFNGPRFAHRATGAGQGKEDRCAFVDLCLVGRKGNRAGAAPAVGHIDRRLPKPLLHRPVLGLFGSGEGVALPIFQNPYRRPVAPVVLLGSVFDDLDLLPDLGVASGQLQGKVLEEAARGSVLRPVTQEPVWSAPVGLHPHDKGRGLPGVGVLLTTLDDELERVSLVCVGVVHAILAEMELQLLRRLVLQHIDLLRQLEAEFAGSANEVVGGRQYNHLERCALHVALVVGDRNQQRFAGRTGREFHLGGEQGRRVPVVAAKDALRVFYHYANG